MTGEKTLPDAVKILAIGFVMILALLVQAFLRWASRQWWPMTIVSYGWTLAVLWFCAEVAWQNRPWKRPGQERSGD